MRRITDRDRVTHIRTRDRDRIVIVMVMAVVTVIVTGAAHTARAPRCLRLYLVPEGARQRGWVRGARGRRRASGGGEIASGRWRVAGRNPTPRAQTNGERTRRTRTRRSAVRARTMSFRRRDRKCALL